MQAPARCTGRDHASSRALSHLHETFFGQVCELTLHDDIKIQWRVAVANLKAGWYEFTNEINLPDGLPIPASKRNAVGPLPLGHHAAAAEIECRGVSGPEYVFEGHFFAAPVFLGERYTDSQGRLLFLGGHGLAEVRWPGTKSTTFANNNLWFGRPDCQTNT